jgi:hypothetical protein
MTTNKPFLFLRIELDGHFHGSSNVPKPWVAKITGSSTKYGLKREFVTPMNDWEKAKKAWSGNLYGITSVFALREGEMYEISRLRGRPSKRHVSREFVWVENRKMHPCTPLDALAYVEKYEGPFKTYLLDDCTDGSKWVENIVGLGDSVKLPWVVVDGKRHYRLRPDHLYEVSNQGKRGLVIVDAELKASLISQEEALRWLTSLEKY